MSATTGTDQNNNMLKPYDTYWAHIIQRNDIDLNKNLVYITAKQIKDCRASWTLDNYQFEPRLLTKMDNSDLRPKIFKDNNTFIISVKNGEYALIKENIYIKLTKFPDISPIIIENKCNSLLLCIGESETSLLDKLYYNNIFNKIIGEKIIYGPLLGGRHRCHFKTIVGNISLEISGSQYETDACYETENYICIVEAKSIECSDFNIRQLYYPFREVYKVVGDKKKIISLFVYKDKEDIIHIYKYKWNNYEIMLDIENIDYYKYKLK